MLLWSLLRHFPNFLLDELLPAQFLCHCTVKKKNKSYVQKNRQSACHVPNKSKPIEERNVCTEIYVGMNKTLAFSTEK